MGKKKLVLASKFSKRTLAGKGFVKGSFFSIIISQMIKIPCCKKKGFAVLTQTTVHYRNM